MLRRLAHYSIRTADLSLSTRFYTEVLGLRVGPRPPFGFPGAWLYLADEGDAEQGTVHLIDAGPGADDDNALGAYLGDRSAPSVDTGAVDHVAFFASDWPACRARFEAAGIPFVERIVPLLNVRQVFLIDPNGVTVELNFTGGPHCDDHRASWRDGRS